MVKRLIVVGFGVLAFIAWRANSSCRGEPELPSPEVLIERALDAYAPRALRMSTKNLRATWAERCGTSIREARAPNSFVGRCGGREYGFDGEHAWVSENGRTDLLTGLVADQVRREAVFTEEVHDVTRVMATMRTVGVTKVDGRSVYKVELRPRDAPDPEYRYFDVATGHTIALEQVVYGPYGLPMGLYVAVFRDFRTFAGRTIPTEVMTLDETSRLTAIAFDVDDMATIRAPDRAVVEGRTLHGIVTLQGVPVAGATVTLDRDGVPDAVTTAADGRFRFESVRSPLERVTAVHGRYAAKSSFGMPSSALNGLAGASDHVSVRAGPDDAIELRLLPHTRVRIEPIGDGPLTNVRASMFFHDVGLPVDVDDRGRLQALIGARARFKVRADGYQLASIKIEPAPGRDVHRTVVLEPAAKASGRVVDEQGRPIVGADVLLEVDGHAIYDAFFGRLVTTSGADGSFRLDGAPPGKHVVRARKGQASTRWTLELPSSEISIVIPLPRSVSP